jgi:ATP-binding cassette, subfamily C (CFTR/MRP), member 1
MAAYKHTFNRLEMKIRAALIGLIHHHALKAQPSAYEDGRAVALMGNDVPGSENSAGLFHEFWGTLVELIAGILMLSWQVGWLWLLPLVIVLGE